MKLVPKLTAAFIVAASVLLAAGGALRVRREVNIVEQNIVRDHQMLARAVAASMAAVLQHEGEAAARHLVEDAGRGAHVTLRWVCRAGELPTATTCADAERLQEGEPKSTTTEKDGHGTRFTYVAIPAIGGVLEVSEPREEELGYTRRAILDNVASALVLSALFSLLAYLLGVTLVGVPVRRLVEKARRVGAGDFSGALPTNSGDELGTLAVEMNGMSERLARAQESLEEETRGRVAAIDRLRHADRLRTVGRLASGIAHEVGTPLNVIEMRASLIAGGEVVGEDALSSARAIAGAADHITKVVQKLLLFARRQGPEAARMEIGAVLGQAVSLVDGLAVQRGVGLSIEGDRALPIEVDGTLLQQAIMNLLVNALQASPRGAKVVVRADRREVTPPPEHGGARAPYVVVSVEDTGAGIAADDLTQLFEPFFTTKTAGEGTGLGLPIASGIVRDHRGWLDVDTALGRGTTMSIYLPEASASPNVDTPLPPAPLPPTPLAPASA